jgi:hypothetical protein
MKGRRLRLWVWVWVSNFIIEKSILRVLRGKWNRNEV